jgi:hypothetical protein
MDGRLPVSSAASESLAVPGSPAAPPFQLFADDDPARLRALARRLAAGAGGHASRSYRDPFGAVVWHGHRVGIDIERIGECGAASVRRFAESICTPDEFGSVGSMLDDTAFVTGLWSSKEALAKALGDAVRYDPRRLAAPALWPGGVGGVWRARSLPGPDGHTVWLVWEEPGLSMAI